MAYSSLVTEFDYKDLLTWQNMDKLAENDNYFKADDATVTGQWTFDNDDTHTTVEIRADGVLAASKHALYVISNAVQVNSDLVKIFQMNAGSSESCLYTINDGTGDNVIISQGGILDASKHALYIYSNVAQTNAELVNIHLDDPTSTQEVIRIRNDGQGHGIAISQTTENTANQYALSVRSEAQQNTSPLSHFHQDHVSSDQSAIAIDNDGTGSGMFISQDGNGIALDIDTEVANLGAALQITPAGGSPDTFAVNRNDNVTGNVVMKLGGGWFSVNTNRPYFRPSAPGVGAVGDHIATSDGDTGGAGSAGGGNQYFELQIGATTFKVLHDGTV